MIDKHSETWRTLAEWIAREIRAQQSRLERDLTLEDTRDARTRLKVLRQIADLPDAKPEALHAETFGISTPEV